VRRREFIGLVGGAALALPFAARAQQPGQVRRISVLMAMAATDADAEPRIRTIQQALQELGWTEGRNIRIDYRWSAVDAESIRAHAAELVGLAPDVIVGVATPVVTALHQETRTIPIVFVQVIDPVSRGFVASLARPGGNITGFTNFDFPMGGKWVQTLKEVAPTVTRVAVIYNPETAPYGAQFLGQIEAAALSFNVNAFDGLVRDTAGLERATSALAAEPNGAMIVLPDVFTTVHRDLIVELAARHQLPGIYPFRYFATSGGLISYGVDALDLFRRSASYVDLILKGTSPSALPVQAPLKFELVINLKTATALGLTAPPSFLARANEVIE
jgi:putative ABC transport system substrate-binding protein